MTEPIGTFLVRVPRRPNAVQRTNRQIAHGLNWAGRLARAAARWLFIDAGGFGYFDDRFYPDDVEYSPAGIILILGAPFWVPVKAVHRLGVGLTSARFKRWLFGPEEE